MTSMVCHSFFHFIKMSGSLRNSSGAIPEYLIHMDIYSYTDYSADSSLFSSSSLSIPQIDRPIKEHVSAEDSYEHSYRSQSRQGMACNNHRNGKNLLIIAASPVRFSSISQLSAPVGSPDKIRTHPTQIPSGSPK